MTRGSGVSRRTFLAGVGGLSLGAAAAVRGAAPARTHAMKIHIFSKHLQWLEYAGMAEAAAQVGFDGVDLTVRPGGHVEPERVEEDLPRAAEAVRKAGLELEMMTTAITDPRDRRTEAVLKTASKAGVKYYRTGSLRYDENVAIPARLDELRPVFRELAELNRHHSVHGAYQNHCGGREVGAPVWDIWELVKDLDRRWMGNQFDIRHATVEGGMAWPIHFRLMAPHVVTIIAKDFLWKKTDRGWQAENCPLGEGMVDFPRYFAMVKKAGIPGPISLHLEYPLGGANHGARTLTVPKEQVLDAMRRDLGVLKRWLAEAGL